MTQFGRLLHERNLRAIRTNCTETLLESSLSAAQFGERCSPKWCYADEGAPNAECVDFMKAQIERYARRDREMRKRQRGEQEGGEAILAIVFAYIGPHVTGLRFLPGTGRVFQLARAVTILHFMLVASLLLVPGGVTLALGEEPAAMLVEVKDAISEVLGDHLIPAVYAARDVALDVFERVVIVSYESMVPLLSSESAWRATERERVVLGTVFGGILYLIPATMAHWINKRSSSGKNAGAT